MEKKLIRWEATEEKLHPKGRFSFCISDFTPQEKKAVLEELKEEFGDSFKIEETNANSIKGFVECYHDEFMDNLDKMLQNGWKW
jgi:hypothetical protein